MLGVAVLRVRFFEETAIVFVNDRNEDFGFWKDGREYLNGVLPSSTTGGLDSPPGATFSFPAPLLEKVEVDIERGVGEKSVA